MADRLRHSRHRNGWPNVLAPDENLEPWPAREKALIAAGYASPLLILATIVAGYMIRS
ncbi:hypothetical protein [Micromonospora sp. CA-111912]|uniref:hypothetical protein n=1 Tax=Micromonospora sp. CA-111912 TaxID=3239955 RepID=UPI003D8F44B2